MSKTKIKTETLAEYLARGGQILKVPTAKQLQVQDRFSRTLKRLFELKQNR